MEERGIEEALVEAEKQKTILRRECVRKMHENEDYKKKKIKHGLIYHEECDNDCKGCMVRKQLDECDRHIDKLLDAQKTINVEDGMQAIKM